MNNYIVLSHDYKNHSSISLHYMGPLKDASIVNYNITSEKYPDRLIELIEMPLFFIGDHDVFRGENKSTQIETIMSNNVTI